MKESKKMVEKEVAFMKKKGAPASMIKHEKAEMETMKRGGKTKKYDGLWGRLARSPDNRFFAGQDTEGKFHTGVIKPMSSSREDEMKRGGKVKKMASGGMTNPKKDPRVAAMMMARRAPAMPGGMPGGAPRMPAPTMAPPPPGANSPMTGMKKGGMSKTMSGDVEKGSNKLTKFGESAVQKRGHTKGKNFGDFGKSVGIMSGAKRFTEGGYVKSADGIAQRGKTRFGMPKMKRRFI